eukprot:tig00000980_g6147.t1
MLERPGRVLVKFLVGLTSETWIDVRCVVSVVDPRLRPRLPSGLARTAVPSAASGPVAIVGGSKLGGSARSDTREASAHAAAKRPYVWPEPPQRRRKSKADLTASRASTSGGANSQSGAAERASCTSVSEPAPAPSNEERAGPEGVDANCSCGAASEPASDSTPRAPSDVAAPAFVSNVAPNPTLVAWAGTGSAVDVCRDPRLAADQLPVPTAALLSSGSPQLDDSRSASCNPSPAPTPAAAAVQSRWEERARSSSEPSATVKPAAPAKPAAPVPYAAAGVPAGAVPPALSSASSNTAPSVPVHAGRPRANSAIKFPSAVASAALNIARRSSTALSKMPPPSELPHTPGAGPSSDGSAPGCLLM